MGYTCIFEVFPQLDDTKRAIVERRISLDKIKSSICDFQGPNSSGPDCMTGDFYKSFPHCVVPVMTKVFQASYDIGFSSTILYSE